MTSFVDRVKANAVDFAATAKAAAQLTWKQAERVKLTRWNLPAAYAALGKQVHSANCHRESFAESHQQIDGLLNDLRSIEQVASNQPPPSGLGDRVKGVTASIRRAFERRLVNRRLTEAFTRLGDSAFRTQGESAGPRELVQPIADRTSRVRELDQQIAELAKVGAGHVVTPKRIQVAAIAGVLFVAVLVISQSLVTNDTDIRIRSAAIADNSKESSAKPSATSKLSALQAIVDKLNSFPDRFASFNERTNYNKELSVLIDEFESIPFDAKHAPDAAKEIVLLYEGKIKSRYTGHLFDILDGHIREIHTTLLLR